MFYIRIIDKCLKSLPMNQQACIDYLAESFSTLLCSRKDVILSYCN